MHFGEHVTIDGYAGKKELLDDQELVFRTLDQLPLKMGIKKLS